MPSHTTQHVLLQVVRRRPWYPAPAHWTNPHPSFPLLQQANLPRAAPPTVGDPNRPLQSVTVLLFQKLLSTSGTFTSPVSRTDRGPMGGGAGARGGGGGPLMSSPPMPSAPPAKPAACAARTAAAVWLSMPAIKLRPARQGQQVRGGQSKGHRSAMTADQGVAGMH
jgi:hypothetical protein